MITTATVTRKKSMNNLTGKRKHTHKWRGETKIKYKKNKKKELAAIKEIQRNMKEMTDKIERENEELKRLTKDELVETRKTQKKMNEEFAQLRRKDSSRVTTQAMV
jgi:hypothetical protein